MALRAGVVGYGYMGEIRHGVVERHPDLTLAGVCDPDPGRRERAAAAGAPATFAGLGDLLAEAAPDLLFVCTPNRHSPEACIAALDAGVHVFCEKPPGRDVDDVARVREAEATAAAGTSGAGAAKLMYGFNHRFHPGIIKGKVIVDSGRLGRIIGLRGLYGKSGGVGFRESWRNDKEMSGGGILLDQGIHMLDLFRYFCGGFDEVKCFVDNRYWGFDIEDNAYVILHNEAGQNALLHSSATFWKHTFRLDIILEEGYLVVEGLLSKSGSYGREQLTVGRRQFEDEAEAVGNPAEEVTYFDRDLSWDLEVAEFVRCIVEDEPVTVSSSKDALAVMDLIARAYTDAGRVPATEATR